MPSPARPRHVAFSHKQKKVQLQTKRALKRGEEVDAPEHGRNGRIRLDRSHKARSEAHDGLELFSRFLAVPRNYIVRTRNAAWSEELQRPLPDSVASFPLELVDNPAGSTLSVPTRPRFSPGETKRSVEENEEIKFQAWLGNARQTVQRWVDNSDAGYSGPNPEANRLRSPSSFETNLEVWRQLWRVVEASSIILLLVDARCPAVHCPPSLRAYLRMLRPRREIILVLTKTDLVNPEALVAWREWLKQWWMSGPPLGDDGLEPQVVSVSSYDTALLYGQGKARHRPHMPDAARHALLDALQIAHARLLSPPSWVASDPKQPATWTPPVRESVHWGELEDGAVCIEDDAETHRQCDDSEGRERHTMPSTTHDSEPLTFGLVGQPNVGKSSLLNALLGETRVRASRTPGKTKHWQTMLWGQRREVRIVDCPGLVCPSLVPMELQAMSGSTSVPFLPVTDAVLPIAQIPSLPACVAFAAKFLPLERIFNIPAPEVIVDDMETKKTWRGDYRPPIVTKTEGPRWTAGHIMDGRATDRGFTKSARPDANRAADAMMRSLAEGRTRWCFWPPNAAPHRDSCGLWLGEFQGTGSEGLTDGESGLGASPRRKASGLKAADPPKPTHATDGNLEEESSDEETASTTANNMSFFAALSLDVGTEAEEE